MKELVYLLWWGVGSDEMLPCLKENIESLAKLESSSAWLPVGVCSLMQESLWM